MDDTITCFDFVSSAAEETAKHFPVPLKIDSEKCGSLKECCRDIDSLAREFGGFSYRAAVDTDTLAVTVGLECMEISLDGGINVLSGLIKRALSLEVSISDRGNLLLRFVFPGIWEPLK